MTSSQGRRKRTGHFFVGLDLAGATGVTPTALLGGSPFIGWHAATGDFLEASLRGTFLRVGTGTLGVPGGGAQFTWDVGRLDGCLLLFPSLGVGTCLRVEAGELEVDGAGIIDAHSQQSAWIALGALARAEWTVVGPFFVDAGVGLLFRITADRFFFIPNTTVYQIPLLAPEAELGVGIHFL